MIDFLVRLVQWHETFRKAELEALAVLAKIRLEIVEYSDDVSTGDEPQPKYTRYL